MRGIEYEADAISRGSGHMAGRSSTPVAPSIHGERAAELAATSIGFNSLKRGWPDQAADVSAFAPKSPRLGKAFTDRMSPAPLTGAAALEDERRRREQQATHSVSENPSHKALSALMAGGDTTMSRPANGTPTSKSSNIALPNITNSLSVSSPQPASPRSKPSAASATSLANLHAPASTTPASSTLVASPTPLTAAHEPQQSGPPPSFALSSSATIDDANANRAHAMSYPGNVLAQADAFRGPARGMSLPMSGIDQQTSSRSPVQKKHECPFCDTEFTRQHNLKSHLLTHSQEKPFVCSTCQMRFRRLHDLKRHTKLHTGERPHICPKCNRKFARGDALARHAKGAGGCAGRRSSIGSYTGDDDYDGPHLDDSMMEGIIHTEPEQTQESMTEDDPRRLSLPSIKAQHVRGFSSSSQDPYTQSRTPSTYPPAGPRPQPTGSSSSLYPPPPADPSASSSSGTSTGQSAQTSMSNTQNSSIGFTQSGMTESPRPLSPSGMSSHQLGLDPGSISRQRSPSLTAQFQQQHFGRRDSSRSSPQMSLPSPHGPKLPGISGLAPPEPRYTLPSQTAQQASSSTQQTQGSLAFQPHMNGSVHGRSGLAGPVQHQSSASSDNSNLFSSGDRGMWNYIQTLEDKVKQLSDRVSTLENVERNSEIRINQLIDELSALRRQAGREM